MKLEIQAPTTRSIVVVPPVSTSALVPFTPDDEMGKPETERIVYQLVPPSFRTRAAADHACMVMQLSQPTDVETNAAAFAAIDTVVKAEQRAEVREALTAYQNLLDDPDALKDDTEARDGVIRAARSIHAQLTRYVPEMQQIIADRVFAHHWTQFTRVRYHVAGWSNVKTPKGNALQYARGADGLVTEELLSLIPLGHIPKIAEKLAALTTPDADVEKNSA